MPAHAKNAGARVGENLGDQKPEFSVPEDRGGLALSKRELLEDLEGGGDGFAENGGFVRDAVRNGVEVGDGDPDELREGTVRTENPQDRPVLAMTPVPGPAFDALPAAEIDLRDNTSPEPLGRPLCHPADKFVAEGAREPHVAARDFEICAADPCEFHLDQRFLGRDLWTRALFHGEFITGPDQGPHFASSCTCEHMGDRSDRRCRS